MPDGKGRGRERLQPASAQTTTTLESPAFLAPGHGIWAALDVSLTFLAWGGGKVGGLLSTSSVLSPQPVSPYMPCVGGAEPKPASCQL